MCDATNHAINNYNNLALCDVVGHTRTRLYGNAMQSEVYQMPSQPIGTSRRGIDASAPATQRRHCRNAVFSSRICHQSIDRTML